MVPIQIMYIDVYMSIVVFLQIERDIFANVGWCVYFLLMVFSSLNGSVDIVQVCSSSSQHIFKGL